jgi:hypothetical protein
LRNWISEILLEDEYDFIEKYLRVGVASPGGNIDGYTPRDLKALLRELADQGHELQEMSIFDGYGEAISEMMAAIED